jgi:hypothetical protein
MPAGGLEQRMISHNVGDRVLLEDGETGVVVSTAEDGTLQLRTATGIVISSAIDDDSDGGASHVSPSC